MNITELEIAVIQETASKQEAAALKELQQLQLATCGGIAGETTLM